MADQILQLRGHSIKLIDNGDDTYSVSTSNEASTDVVEVTGMGEVQTTPTANTLLGRLKDLITGIVLAAGSAIIGKVGIDQTTDGTTNKVRASQPTHDNLQANVNIQVGDVDVAKTNPVPSISPASNPSGSITRAANVTAYTANDVISTTGGANLEFATGFANGTKFAIYSAIMRSDDAAVIADMATYRLHLYNAAPTAIADNAAHAVITADAAKYLGYITLETLEDAGDFLVKYTKEINSVMSLAAAGASIYGQLQTIGAYTPASGTVYNIELTIGAL